MVDLPNLDGFATGNVVAMDLSMIVDVSRWKYSEVAEEEMWLRLTERKVGKRRF